MTQAQTGGWSWRMLSHGKLLSGVQIWPGFHQWLIDIATRVGQDRRRLRVTLWKAAVNSKNVPYARKRLVKLSDSYWYRYYSRYFIFISMSALSCTSFTLRGARDAKGSGIEALAPDYGRVFWKRVSNSGVRQCRMTSPMVSNGLSRRVCGSQAYRHLRRNLRWLCHFGRSDLYSGPLCRRCRLYVGVANLFTFMNAIPPY